MSGSLIQVCSFCQKPVYPGKGVTFVRNDGTLFRFCTGKCTKAFKMKRNPRRVKHTQAYRAAQGKLLLNDPAFLIEKRRNRAVRYSRALWQKTQDAMDRLAALQFQRNQRAALERRRAHALRMLSTAKARNLGFSADVNVPLPDMARFDRTRAKPMSKVRATMAHKVNLKYATRVAQKIREQKAADAGEDQEKK